MVDLFADFFYLGVLLAVNVIITSCELSYISYLVSLYCLVGRILFLVNCRLECIINSLLKYLVSKQFVCVCLVVSRVDLTLCHINCHVDLILCHVDCHVDPFYRKRNIARSLSHGQIYEYIDDRLRAAYKYFAVLPEQDDINSASIFQFNQDILGDSKVGISQGKLPRKLLSSIDKWLCIVYSHGNGG